MVENDLASLCIGDALCWQRVDFIQVLPESLENVNPHPYLGLLVQRRVYRAYACACKSLLGARSGDS